MKRLYFDTNQLYYIRKIYEEAQGWDYGNYKWAYRLFPNNPDLIADVRALCFIVAMQYEWGLDFLPSSASFTELSLSSSKRAKATRDIWRSFVQVLQGDQILQKVPFLPSWPVSGRLNLAFVEDLDDRVILRHFASEKADVLLTSDGGILKHKTRLAKLGITVMRPSEWLNEFLANVSEDAVAWLERILFGIGS